MIDYYKDFLLNAFVLFSPIVFYPYILKKKKKVGVHRLLKYSFFALAMIFTMSFPVHLNGVIYDFRSIPMAISFMYGGLEVTAMIYLTLVVYRYFMGNPNTLIYLLSLIPSFVLISYLAKKYSPVRLKAKTAYVMLICTLIKIMVIPLYLALDGNLPLLLNNLVPTLETYVVQALIAGLFVCLMEYANKYFVMHEEIIASEKIKIVSDLAASVAHEIRNPLTSVKGFIQLLGNDEVPSQRRDYYRKICLEELERAQAIITDYLSLAKPDPEFVERISVKEEVEYVSNILLTFANYKNVEIHTRLHAEAYVQGDKQKFRQALINIGKNAIEAMPDGGELHLVLARKNQAAILTIKDNGVGMTREQIGRLGTPYYSTKEKGTGLGTMVSFGIIRNMQGKIEIESEPGKGTAFQIIFAA